MVGSRGEGGLAKVYATLINRLLVAMGSGYRCQAIQRTGRSSCVGKKGGEGEWKVWLN